MALFTYTINYVIDEETKKAILGIAKTQEKIMALVEQLEEKILGLQTSVDTFQEVAITKVAELNAVITDFYLSDFDSVLQILEYDKCKWSYEQTEGTE